MTADELPYFNIQQDGHWTWQCPHEPYSDIYITIIGKGEIVYCQKCANKIKKTLKLTREK